MKIETIEIWDAGMYNAKVLRCEAAESTFKGKEGTPRFKWTLRLTNPETDEYNDIPYYTNVTMSAHQQARLRPMVRAILPHLDLNDPEVVKEIDTDDLIGKRCRVVLGIDEEKGRNTVDKIMPPEGGKAATPTAAAAKQEWVPF